MEPFLIDIRVADIPTALGYRVLGLKFQNDEGKTIGYEMVFEMGESLTSVLSRLDSTSKGLFQFKRSLS